MKKTTLLCMLAAASSFVASGQTDNNPEYKLYKFDDGAVVTGLSDNGLWAVTRGANANDATASVGARLINVKTGEAQVLIDGLNADTISSNGVFDVSNDGNIVVGELNSKPAYYSASTGKWTFLSLGGGADRGEVSSVSADGKYAVGRLSYSDVGRLYEESVCLWDIQTGKMISTPGIPTKDMSHVDQKQNRFVNISSDGTKILGCMSFSYLPSDTDLGGIFYYVYDLNTHTYKPIGFDETESGRWTPHVEGIFYIGEARMSNDGSYVTGGAYMVKETAGSDFPSEYEVPFVYEVSTGKITVYDDSESADMYGWSVDNEGNTYGAGPAANPYRDFGVRSGKYWIGFPQAVKQTYGVDILTDMGLTNSGTPVAVSDDGRTLVSISGITDSYIVTLPERFSSIAASTNLLSDYSIWPANGTSLSKLETVTLTFGRNVKVVASPAAVTLKDQIGNSNVANAVGFEAEGNVVTITFRSAELSKHNMPYRLTIPARTICIDGDVTRLNEEIVVNYKGRTEQPVSMVSVSPKDGASVGMLNLNTSPIMFTFDAAVQPTGENVRGKLYQGDSKEPFAELLLSNSDVFVAAYPSTTQYLYKGVDYRIEIPAGVYTDVTGNAKTANEAITIYYQGAYEREISYDDNVLFEDDFSNGVLGFLVYDNDGNTPDSESEAIGFDSSNLGWTYVMDEGIADFAAGSTSMYNPAGKSDDWMVIPQINVVDQLCKLTFQSQSYRNSATDRLKVYVWESNNMYNALDAEVVNKIRTEGTLVYNEIQSPGADENMLKGDWQDNVVDLKDFAGKNVYIAFLNDNENQSAIFVDNVKVLHELPFYVAVTNEDAVVDKDEITIEGVVDIRDEEETFTTAQLTLKNAVGSVVDQINATGLSLKKGDKYEFAFSKPLPLTVGEQNDYTIELKFNEVENKVQKAVKSLVFKPTKRVVLEEFTGTDCVNCPQGIEAISKLHNYYGDLFIPMALHCYTGDPFATGVTGYAAFLNLVAAPSGMIQRSGTISYPMLNDGGDYMFNAPEGKDALWMDIVAEELDTPVEAEITATAALSASGTSYSVPVDVKYALNGKNLNHKIFAVVLENGLVSYQRNGFASVEDEDLGEWGKDGEYSKPVVSPYTFDHVVRGWNGTTFTGTPELLPADVEAGKTYSTTLEFAVPSPVSKAWNTDIVVMLFDGNTDKLINAYKTSVTVPEGIDDVQSDAPEAVGISVQQGAVLVNAPADASVQVLSVDGRIMAQASGNGQFSVAVPAYRGVAIVRVATAKGSVVKKVVL